MSINVKPIKKKGNFFLEWVIPIVLAIIIAILIKEFVFFKIKVPTGSMKPTINEGDQFIVTRVYNPENLKRGDVVVFDSDEYNETMIKRLIGLPGDTIDIDNGIVSVNGEVLDEEYVKYNQKFNGHYDVPENKYFFLGDNRGNSKDSRYWKKDHYIDESKIKAKAQLKIYPFKDFGLVK